MTPARFLASITEASQVISPQQLQQISFTRKPQRWEDIKKARIARHQLAQLRTIPAEALFKGSGGSDAPPMAKFSNPVDEQYFILERNGNLYLVDTGGYDYARYIVELHSLGTPL